MVQYQMGIERKVSSDELGIFCGVKYWNGIGMSIGCQRQVIARGHVRQLRTRYCFLERDPFLDRFSRLFRIEGVCVWLEVS